MQNIAFRLVGIYVRYDFNVKHCSKVMVMSGAYSQHDKSVKKSININNGQLLHV